MHVIASFTLVPIGVGVSLSPYIAQLKVPLEASGLEYQMHANGTNIEGEWEAVMAVVKACHQAVHSAGAPRIHTAMQIGTRSDKVQRMGDKLASVEAKQTA